MKANELYSELKKICDKVAYSAFKSRQEPPYIVYLQSAVASGGDFDIHITTNSYTVEVYTNKRDMELENKIESMLKSYGIAFDVEYAIYINDSKLFMTVYEFETYTKGA